MSKANRSALMVVVLLTVLALGSQGASPSSTRSNPDDFWNFYETYPGMQDFYPVGLYGDRAGYSGLFGSVRNMRGELIRGGQIYDMSLDVFARYNINSIWETGIRRFTVTHQYGAKGFDECWPDPMKPKLAPFGKWYLWRSVPFS